MERTPLEVRKIEENRDTTSLPKHKHWFRTHELAFYILNNFSKKNQLDSVKKYFAHANSAKCCMNKPGRKKADKQLFSNCRNYLQKELMILKPDIIVTQGDEAKRAIMKFSTTIQKYDSFSQIASLNGKNIFWLHTFHPNNWGSFNKQRNNGKSWEEYSKKIYKWYVKN